MEEALIQYISLLLIVAIFHSSPPSFRTAGIVTQLQQFTCSEERGVTILGLISLSLCKLHCSAGLSITRIFLQVSSIPHPRSLSCPSSQPQWTRTRTATASEASKITLLAGQLHRETPALLTWYYCSVLIICII